MREPIVVASAHRAPLDALATRSGWAAITGETPPAERTRIEDAFQAGHLKGVALSIKAGGVAITLTRASNMIFIDKAWTPGDNLQASDRIHRIGSTKNVNIISLVADHALDARIDELLAIKQAFLEKSVDAAQRGATETPDQEVADLDAAAAQLAQAQADLEVEVARQRAEWEKRKAARAERDAKDAEERAERDAQQKEGNARAKARKALTNRGHAKFVEEAPIDEERRGPVGEREEWAMRGLVYLASMDADHAYHDNDVGFSRADGAMGHSLAERVHDGLVDVEWKLAVVMLFKYQRNQIGACPGSPIDREQQRVPAGAVRDCATEDAAAEVAS